MVVKRITTNDDQGFPVRYLREVSLLRACDHPNVMKLHFANYHKGRLALFSEYIGQNLEDRIAARAPCAPGSPAHAAAMLECRGFMAQILAGVACAPPTTTTVTPSLSLIS